MSILINKDKTHTFFSWILHNFERVQGKMLNLTGLWLAIGVSLVFAGRRYF